MVLSKLEQPLYTDKCPFMKDSVEYLGHRINKKGLHTVQEKTDKIENVLQSYYLLVHYDEKKKVTLACNSVGRGSFAQNK